MKAPCLILPICAVAAWLFFLPIKTAADSDVGNIAVIETDPTILQPGEAFDLNNQTLTFTPKSGGGYTVSVGALDFDSTLGSNLALSDDGFIQQNLSFNFSFFSVNHTSVFINANGNLTFGSGSSFAHFNSGGSVTSLGTDIADALVRIGAGQARIAVLWQDWDPSAGGGVFASSRSDRLVVTWQDVPLFNTSTTATFQVILFSSGVIQMNYQNVASTPGGGYLVGISPGASSEFLVTTIDFSEGSASSISSTPSIEPVAQVFGSTSSPLVHVTAVARRFYQSHDDDFDQLVMFANFSHAMGTAFAFHLRYRQSVQGIGLGLSNFSSFTASDGRLQGFLNMNRLSLYPADPNSLVPGIGTNSTLDVMGQEAGHQWLAFTEFDNGGVCSSLLLGRDLAHWSFFHDTDASDMEGNEWQDNGDGTFTTTEATARFSALDQYVVGLRPSSEVATFFFISNPTDTTKTRSSAPEIGVTVSGMRQNVTVNQVITCEGARSPSSGFTGVNSTTTWKQAFVLLIQGDTTAPSADTTKLDTIRTAWESYFSSATGGRGAVDTTLPQPAISVTPSSQNFGNVNVGSTADRNFTVQNSGGGTLSGSASTSSPFSMVSGGSYSLGAGASQTVTVRFSPTSAGTFMGNVNFTGGGGVSRTLTGTGVAMLTVNTAGTGSGTVTSSPSGINCGTDCAETYTTASSVTLTASAASGSRFAGWSGGGCSGTATCTVTMSANVTVTATFNLAFTLTVSKAGSGEGTITSSPSGITCGSTCSASFDRDSSVTLTASASSGSSFKSWSGACTGTGTCTVSMTAARSVTATFSKTFTDDPLTAQVTAVKAAHFTELREAINTLRSNNGVSTFTFTDSTLTAGGTSVKAVHITELRSALNGVYDALSHVRPSYTDSTLTAQQTVIKKAHIAEIRSAVRDVE